MSAMETTPELDAEADKNFATKLRGFGPVGILAFFIITITGGIQWSGYIVVPAGALLVLVWAWTSRTPWREIGFGRPESWALTVALGIPFGIALKFAMKAIVMPLLGADPVNHAFHYLTGNRAAIPGFLFSVIFGAGFGEETYFRGYLFERLRKLFGWSTAAKIGIVLGSSIWFGWDHYAVQGLAGAEQAAMVGLVFGTIAAATGRIWMLMIAHAAFDVTAYGMIYWNLETAVAHLVFR